ncbi:MAG: beta-galactosidase [Clostridiaceae bacterium]|nr:beta-galactosidase [Clostridiaceae bacterium]
MNIRFGADYYPEHWDEKRLETDAKLMHDMGIDVVRMAEFSWSKLEPEKGIFQFDWLDNAINTLAKYNIRVVLGTPSAAPPAWIIEEIPDLLPLDSQGRVRGFGGRHHNCQSNIAYKEHIKRLVSKMAHHYKDNPNVIGWQIDNELGNSHNDLCHCKSCREHFQKWLQYKYKTIEQLNKEWGTNFWSQTYDKFEQIPTPMITPTSHNPSLLLDWKRFHSDLIVEFQQFQIDILREICPHQFITHNLMGFFNLIDYFDLADNLDFVSHDQYPMGFYDDPQPIKEPSALAADLDLMRSLKNQTFWIMEQQAGPSGWEILGRTPKPGQLALWAAQSIAHGADTVVFFRWRTCAYGTEEYWHGILPHSGIPGRRYYELQKFIQEIVPHMENFKNSLPESEVAILYSYEQSWAFEIQPHHPELNYINQIRKYYKGLYNQNIPVDFISGNNNFEKYKLVIAPLQFLVSDKLVESLTEYVEQGGILVLTMRSGVKEMNNQCHIEADLPGKLTGLVGATITDYDCLRDHDMGIRYKDTDYRCEKWCDILKPEKAESISKYTEDFYAGQPAITVNKSGKGLVYYIGTEPEQKLIDDFLADIVNESGIERIYDTPAEVEFVRRRTKDADYIFALNHTGKTQIINCKDNWKSIINNEKLEPYGYALFMAER